MKKRTPKQLERICNIRDNAKAIYLLSDLKEMTLYLNAYIELGTITEEEADLITDVVTDGCKNVKQYQIENFREQLYGMC